MLTRRKIRWGTLEICSSNALLGTSCSSRTAAARAQGSHMRSQWLAAVAVYWLGMAGYIVTTVGCGFFDANIPVLDPRSIAGYGGYHCSIRTANSGAKKLRTLSTASCSLIQVIYLIWIPNSSLCFSMHDAQLVLSMLLNDPCPEVLLSVYSIASSTGAAETIDHLRL